MNYNYKAIILWFVTLAVVYTLSVIVQTVHALYNVAFHPTTKADDFVLREMAYDIDELVANHGYPLETHNVVTQDEYILQMHRIPHAKDTTKSHKNRPVILIMHGMASSSVVWLLGGPNSSIVYHLVDAGFDVWLGNLRGNPYSRKHLHINPDTENERFFNFTLHEMGIYDIPAHIDYVLNTTNSSSLYYIGHSMGCTTSFIALSEFPSYNAKIKLLIALAPVIFTSGCVSLSLHLPYWIQSFWMPIVKYFGQYELIPRLDYYRQFANFVARSDGHLQVYLKYFACSFGGCGSNFNDTLLPLVLTHMPAGISLTTLMHYFQFYTTEKFQRYNYGKTKNMELYNQETAPHYNTNNIATPIAIFYGHKDWITSDYDITLLKQHIPSVVSVLKLETFTHTDFVVQQNMHVLNKLIVNAIRNYK